MLTRFLHLCVSRLSVYPFLPTQKPELVAKANEFFGILSTWKNNISVCLCFCMCMCNVHVLRVYVRVCVWKYMWKYMWKCFMCVCACVCVLLCMCAPVYVCVYVHRIRLVGWCVTLGEPASAAASHAASDDDDDWATGHTEWKHRFEEIGFYYKTIGEEST